MKRFLSSLLVLCMAMTFLPASAAAASVSPFGDVQSTDWYYDEVQYVYENGLMSGTSATTFSPDATTTRGMIVTILHRLEGTPAVSTSGTFADVAAGQYYTDAVEWASANGIVGGYGNGRFGPNDPITREQLAAMMYRYADFLGMDTAASGSLTCRLRGNASRQQTEGREQSRPRNLNSKHRIQIYQNRILIYPPNPRPK